MIRILLPATIGLVAILSLSFYEGYALKDRWVEPDLQAKQLGERFKHVPLNVGSWEGEDLPVDEITRNTAGAVNYVSRRYTHAITGKRVVLWLIVGHSKDVTRHTPDICYPSQGFREVSSQLRHHIKTSNDKPAVFYTSRFEKESPTERKTERVFWTFNHPDKNRWEAPENDGWMSGARRYYGLSRALYKLYFTSEVGRTEETIEANAAIEFAEVMLPAIDEALFPNSAGSAAEAIDVSATDSDPQIATH